MPVGSARGFMPEAFGQKQYGAYLCFKGFGFKKFQSIKKYIFTDV
jgi:hypothetical protein